MPHAVPAAAIAAAAAVSLLAAGEARAGEPVHGALDGRVFVATITVEGYDAPFPDRISFAEGTFFSEECQRACDFGRSAYFTRVEGDAVAFVVEAACSDAPQSTRWTGRVTGDRIEGSVIWTVERFYWTVQRRATFSGTLATGADAQTAAVME